MRFTHRAPSRALFTVAAAGAAATLGMAASLAFGAGVAAAHVHVDADDAAPGSTAVLQFRVPGESDDGSLTTVFSVALPSVASARTEVMPGWSARLDRDAAAGTVRAVTWTAAPGTGIAADQFAVFRVSVALPDATSVTLPATQTYSDGKVVRWDQPPLPGGGEPDYPAPVLNLTAAASGDDDHGGHSMPSAPSGTPPTADAGSAQPAGSGVAGSGVADDTARWLAGGALVLAAAGVVIALLGRRSA